MFDFYLELFQICWNNYCENEKSKPDPILSWLYTIVLSFVFGIVIGLLYCEYIAELPNHVQPPISDFWFQLLDEFGV